MKTKVVQIQTQIAAAEAERKRIREVFEREVSQRCIYRLLFDSLLEGPANDSPFWSQ